MDADAAFAEEVEVARDYFRDFLEWESVSLGRTSRNPLPYFARLKAERPDRYIDKQAVLLATNVTLDPDDGRQLLQAMLGGLKALPATLPEGGAGDDLASLRKLEDR